MKKRNRVKKEHGGLVIDAINAMKETGRGEIDSDVQGSYRGISDDGKHPVQDSDDL